MTISQVFRWFCKEHKIMHKIQQMYYELHPYEVVLKDDGSLSQKYLTFDEYVNNSVSNLGFVYFMERFMDEYRSRVRSKKEYIDYWDWYTKFSEENQYIIRKWHYFAKNNIVLDSDWMKQGATLRCRHYNCPREVVVNSINVSENRVTVHSNTNLTYGVRLCDFVDEEGNKLEINYAIKRNRKVYYGKN